VAEIAAASVRIESCDMDEENWRFHKAQRAEFYWDEDRRAEAESLMSELPHSPGTVVAFLRQSLHGAVRLRQAFTALGASIAGGPGGEGPRPLDEAGRRRGFDLLGLDPEERLGITPLDLPFGTPAADAALAAHQADVIARELADLDRLTSERYVEFDEQNRLETELGNFFGIDDTTRLIRRYRSEARGRRNRALKELQRMQEAAEELALDEPEDEFLRRNAAKLLRAMPSGRTESPEKRTPAGPKPPPPRPQAAAEKPAQAAGAGEGATPPSAGVVTNPQAGGPAPGPGPRDEPQDDRRGREDWPPGAEEYVQKAAHRTMQ
jgi:hypothetical protein